MATPVRDLRSAYAADGRADVLAVHPGEILLEDFLKPMGITQTRLASDLGIPIRRINEIIVGKRAVSPETAWLLAEYFDTAVEFWAGLQMDYELQLAGRLVAPKLRQIRHPGQAAVGQSA